MHHKTNILGDFWTILKVILEIIVSLALTCFLGPLFLFLWICNEFTRLVISVILYIQFSSKVKLVASGSDAIWHYQKKGNNRMCIIVLFSKTPVDINARREKFMSDIIQKTLPDGRKPYSKLVKTFIRKYGYDCFKSGDFQIESHVRLYDMSKIPGATTTTTTTKDYFTEEEFMSEVMPNLGQDMDDSKPQWEELIIPKVKLRDVESYQSGRCLRYHHGFMDGASANLLMSHCMHDSSTQGEFPYIIDPLKKLKVSKFRIFCVQILCGLRASFTLLKTLYLAGRVKGRFVTVLSGQRHFNWSEKIDASALRRVKTCMKVSAPTVLATAAGGALRKLNKAYPSRGSMYESKVVVGMINALIPYPDLCPRNRFTLTHMPLPIGELEWEKRMSEVDKEMRALPTNPSFYLTQFMFSFFGRFPYPVVQILMDGGGNPISFSNVPFTNKRMTLWGSEIEECGGWPPLMTNTGMGIIIMRYADHIRFMGVADNACLSAKEMGYFLSQVKIEILKMAEDCCSPANPRILNVTEPPKVNHSNLV